MTYKPKTTKSEAGKYTLRYGKGSKKLEAVLEQVNNGEWEVVSGDGFSETGSGSYKTKKDALAAWGVWADRNYGSDAAKSPRSNGQPSDPTPTPHARSGGPPRYKPGLREKGPPKRRSKKTSSPKPTHSHPENLDFEFGADPFDGRFKYPSDYEVESRRGALTPLGVLVEIEKWSRRYAKQIKGVYAFEPLKESVRAAIAREAPDLIKGDGNVRSIEETAEERRESRDRAPEGDGNGTGERNPTPF